MPLGKCKNKFTYYFLTFEKENLMPSSVKVKYEYTDSSGRKIINRVQFTAHNERSTESDILEKTKSRTSWSQRNCNY